MTATALPSQRTAARSQRGAGALGKVKKLFFPVSATYLFMIIPAIILFTFFIIYPAVVGMFYSFTNYVGYGTWHFVGPPITRPRSATRPSGIPTGSRCSSPSWRASSPT